MSYRSAMFALVLLLATPTLAWAQSYAIQGAESMFRVEFEAVNGPRGPVVAGYVYNRTGLTADRLRLGIDGLDGAGQVKWSTIGYVMGTVPGNNRAYFEVRVQEPGPYRVRVLSWDPIGRGGP